MLLQLEKATHHLFLPFSLSPQMFHYPNSKGGFGTIYVHTPLGGPLPSVTPSSEIYSRGTQVARCHRVFLGYSFQLGILGPCSIPFYSTLRGSSLDTPRLWVGPVFLAAQDSRLMVPWLAAGSASPACCSPGGSHPLLHLAFLSRCATSCPRVLPSPLFLVENYFQLLHSPFFVYSLFLLEHILGQFSKKGCMRERFVSAYVFFCCQNMLPQTQHVLPLSSGGRRGWDGIQAHFLQGCIGVWF